jgi:hypothetical protein
MTEPVNARHDQRQANWLHRLVLLPGSEREFGFNPHVQDCGIGRKALPETSPP